MDPSQSDFQTRASTDQRSAAADAAPAHRRPSPTREVLWRWRYAIASTLALALAELFYQEFLSDRPLLDVPRFVEVAGWTIIALTALILCHNIGFLKDVSRGMARLARFAGNLARLRLRGMMIVLVLLAGGLRFVMSFGLPGVVMCGVLGVLLFILVFLCWIYRRRSLEREALAEILAMAARASLPLGPAARVLGRLGGGRLEQSIAALADRLDAGSTLSESFQAHPDTATSESRLFARVGEDWSILDRSLGEAAVQARLRRTNPVSIFAMFVYPGLVLAAVGLGSLGLIFWIGSAGIEILADTRNVPHPPWPGPNGMLARSGTIFWSLLFTAALPVAACVAGLALLLYVGKLILERTGHAVPTPGGWLGRRREAAALLRALALGMEQSRPIPELLATLCQAAPSAWAQQRLRRVRQDVERGQPWQRSLQKHSLIGPAPAAVLAAAERAGNLPWAAREMAILLERSAVQRLRLAGLVAQPLLLFAAGLFALFAALSYFVPLVSTIQRLAEDIS